MRKFYLLLITIFAFSNSYSQEFYFLTGNNFTKYNFTSESGPIKIIFLAGVGSTYELGYMRPMSNKRFSHTIAVNLNDYNSISGDFASSYKWNTKYLGVNNSVDLTVQLSSKFRLLLKAGLNLSTIIYGTQEVNGAFTDIVNKDAYSGLTFLPNAGVQLKYKLNDLGYLSFGYGLSQSVILFNISKDKLTTNTNQILFGIHFNIIKK